MVVPATIFFLLSFVAPIILVGRLSLFSTDYVTSEFVGLGNFIYALQDEYFLRSFFNVACFVAMTAPLSLLMTYWLSMFLFGLGRKLESAGRFIVYVPALTSGLIMTLLWGWFLYRDGLINQGLLALGLQAVPWLAQPWTARVSVVLVNLSSGPGPFVILLLAAMHTIPQELHDAALIDGASEGQYRRMVVRPLLTPTLLLMLLLVIIGTMQIWETIYVLTGEGGPGGSTATPVYEIFQTAFFYGRPGYAAAKGIILLVVIAAIVVAKQRIERWAGQKE